MGRKTGKRSAALVLPFFLGLANPAAGACMGESCANGVVRICERQNNGESVWVNMTPVTRCDRASVSPNRKIDRPKVPATK